MMCLLIRRKRHRQKNTMKQCFKCKDTKPLSEFYAHSRMADGHVNKCKECNKIDVVKNRLKKLEYYHNYDRNRAKLTPRKISASKRNFWSKIVSPDKYKARIKIGNAVRRGKIKRLPCENCGNENTEAHHTDYSKPLEVRWLCPKCHHAEHRKYDYNNLPEIKSKLGG